MRCLVEHIDSPQPGASAANRRPPEAAAPSLQDRFRVGRRAVIAVRVARNRHWSAMTVSPMPAEPIDAAVREARALVAGYPAALSLRAAAFIVTLYGDVVVPRGGSLWIGNVIEACAEVGISETLVRTAVSRLVADGRLAGTRAGRRSFYSLTPDARAEFERAADILYAGPVAPDPDEWTLVLAGDGGARPAVEALAKTGFGLAGAGLALRPGSPPAAGCGPGTLVFRARLEEASSADALRSLAASAWDLAELAAEYDRFIALLEPLAAGLRGGSGIDGTRMDGTLALTVRLLLVHAFRRTALRDPRLPTDALPEDWSGHAARRLFGSVYRALSPAADAHVARRFVDGDGPIGATPGSLQRRLRGLARESGR